MLRSSHIFVFWFLVFWSLQLHDFHSGFFFRLAHLALQNVNKYYIIFVYIQQGKMGKTLKNRKESHATKVTKIAKTKRRKYGMNETFVAIILQCKILVLHFRLGLSWKKSYNLKADDRVLLLTFFKNNNKKTILILIEPVKPVLLGL